MKSKKILTVLVMLTVQAVIFAPCFFDTMGVNIVLTVVASFIPRKKNDAITEFFGTETRIDIPTIINVIECGFITVIVASFLQNVMLLMAAAIIATSAVITFIALTIYIFIKNSIIVEVKETEQEYR